MPAECGEKCRAEYLYPTLSLPAVCEIQRDIEKTTTTTTILASIADHSVTSPAVLLGSSHSIIYQCVTESLYKI